VTHIYVLFQLVGAMENIREGSFIARLSWIVFLLNIPCEVGLFITWGVESEMKLYSFTFLCVMGI
jgi:hypothetical protein